MILNGISVKELPKSQIVNNPEIMYAKVKESPLTPLISNNICILSTTFFRTLSEKYHEDHDKEIILQTVNARDYEFTRDFYIDDDWQGLPEPRKGI